MSRVVEIFQFLIRRLVDGVLVPFNGFSQVIGLSVVSILAGVVLILCYKQVSFQSALSETKRKIYASLLESVVFRHSTIECLRAQKQMLLYGARYLLLAIPPILILAVPSIFLLAELQTRYGYRPIRSGEQIIVRAKVKDSKLVNQVELSVSPGVQIVGPVRSKKSSELFWRLSSPDPGIYEAIIKVAGVPLISQEIVVDKKVPRIAPTHYYSGWHQLLFPLDLVHKSTRDSVSEISFIYPELKIDFFGTKMNWVYTFLIVSMVAGIFVSRIFKIEI